MANKLYGGAARKISKPHVDKLSAMVMSRERALGEIQRDFLTEGKH